QWVTPSPARPPTSGSERSARLAAAPADPASSSSVRYTDGDWGSPRHAFSSGLLRNALSRAAVCRIVVASPSWGSAPLSGAAALESWTVEAVFSIPAFLGRD